MRYAFRTIEEKWIRRWEESRAHRAPARPRRKAYVLEMFLYPSGDIHMGHFRNYTVGDVIARYRRMRGFDVLHPVGFDAFGLPAEEAAIRRGRHPEEWTRGNIETARRSLRKMALAYDWTREITTCDPAYYRWTQWIFLKLHERDLAYRARSTVNWCPHCNTVLANEQVEGGQCWRCESGVTRKDLEQWYFRITAYADRLLEGLDRLDQWPARVRSLQRNWIGRSEGAEVTFDAEGTPLEVFTTRPDTLFGVTFLAVAPEHPIAREAAGRDAAVASFLAEAAKRTDRERAQSGREGVAAGRSARHALTGEAIPIWVADYVVGGYGTGVVMGVPAHDARDFAFARAHDLPVRPVVHPEGGRLDPETMTDAFEAHGVLGDSGAFSGQTSDAAMQAITTALETRGLGRAKVNYHLRDWLLSRQRYWGAPIPMIHCKGCGIVPVPEDQLPVVLPGKIEEWVPSGRSPLEDVASFIETTCPRCAGPARRDPDTMDTFVDSSWYFLRYCDPHNDREPFSRASIATWGPVDLYIGGIDHATGHLLYFRFVTKVLHDAGWLPFEEPVVRLFNHGMVLDDQGAKMSKSKGNLVAPAKLFETWGVDASRVAMLFLGPSAWEIRWSEQGIKGVVRFLERVHGLVEETAEEARAGQNRTGEGPASEKRTGATAGPKGVAGDGKTDGESGKALRRRLHQTILKVTEEMEEGFAFNTAIAACMELLTALRQHRTAWRTAAKDRTGAKDFAAAGGRALDREAVEALVRLLAPMAPCLAEEWWELLGHPESVFRGPWPEGDRALAAAEEWEVALQVNGKVRSRLRVREDWTEEQIREKALEDAKVRESMAGKSVRRVIVIPRRLVNLVV